MLEPLGDLSFEEAVSIFASNVRAAADRADLIIIETMNDCLETKAAVIAAKENSSLPIFVTNVYDRSGKLMTGADPACDDRDARGARRRCDRNELLVRSRRYA